MLSSNLIIVWLNFYVY